MMSVLKYCILGVILFAIGTSPLLFAADTIEPDPVLDNFNVDNALGDVRTLKSSIDLLTQELFILDQQESNSNGISEKYREVRAEIVSVITAIQYTTDQIDTMMRKVATYKRTIDNAVETVKKLRQEIEETKKYLQEFALFLYQTSNYIADPQKGVIDEVKLLLHSNNIPRTLANQQIIESMMYQFTDLLIELDAAEKQHLQAVMKLNELRVNAKNDIAIYTAEIEKMQQKKTYLVQFIELYKNGTLQSYNMGGVFQTSKSVHDAVVSMVDNIAKQNYNVSFNIFDALKTLDTLSNNTKLPHDIAWPIYPIQNVIHFFDDPDFRESYGFPHWGIQISAQQGTPVYSVRDGVVYYINDQDGIGINWLLVIHTDGYVSAYTYINNIVVQEGDIVTRGQLLGYSGGEPGTRGAGFMSPGSNLSFSVFKNGAPINPLDVLDISVVLDKDTLPSAYSIKYLRDKYARGVDISELPILSGATVDERAQSFASSYGVGVYRTLSFWDSAVVGTNIDRDMVICVAFAESTLGRYLSTANNIGNIGNNDRGDRFAFGSALAGARAIAQTLNNQYLGHYHTIDQLSRYGNSDGAIYASSPINWQTNVLKCLSQIKGYYVPEDFPFRTGVNPNWSADRVVSGGFDWQQVRHGNNEIAE